MLESIHIKNFKAWKDTGQLRFAPLTVLFGANSAGKSSIGHLILALKQTVLTADRKRALHLGDAKSLVDLGTFTDCIYRHDVSLPLEFSLGWRLDHALEVKNPVKPSQSFIGRSLGLDVSIEANGLAQPVVRNLKYELKCDSGKDLEIRYGIDDKREYQLESDAFSFVRTTGRAWQLDAPEKFYRISDQSRARYQNASFLSDFALEIEALFNSVHHLGPLREYPQRIYPWSGESFEDVGGKGENAIGAMLAAQAAGRRLNRRAKGANADFIPFIASWLKDLGIIHDFTLKAVAEGRKEYEVLVKVGAKSSEVRITDVGFGVSQVLPAIVQSFYSPPHSIVLMEQPEIHLHPQVQAELADVFISAIQARENGNPRGVQLIIESHSEHFLNRLQRRIAEQALSPEELAVYFCSTGKGNPVMEALEIDEYGDISNWPEKFFADDMGEITARTIAAMRRRQGNEGS
ncbi:MAG: DUF3696 domain-containing protein [Treponema sp.]|nr:DUF3696 domain-containing protein [Treponema sp.]